MKNLLLLTFLWLTLLSANAQQPAIPISSFGIWDRGGVILANPTFARNKIFKGSQLDIKWKDLQPTDSLHYDWSVFDKNLKIAADNNIFLYLTLYVGPDSPDWIYTAGKVPKVFTINTKHPWPYYPYYLSPNYERLWHKMIEAAGQYFREKIPSTWNKSIGFIQVVDGCTGDVVPYKGDLIDSTTQLPNNKYAISDTQFDTFRFRGFSKYKAAFLDGNQETRIPLLFNGVNDEDPNGAAGWKWVTDSLKEGFGMKCGTTVRGVALNGEKKFKDGYSKYFINPQGLACFGRSEMDMGCTFPLFMKNLEIAYYWAILNGLNTGTSIHDVNKTSSDQAFSRPEVLKSFQFFNKYAPQVFAPQCTGAYSVFHRGLNAANTTLYPENAKYGGSAIMSNLARYKAICQTEANHGAKISDDSTVVLGKNPQRNYQKDYNDVGFDIDEGNFERFITQIAPDSTSAGLWRVRGTLTGASSKYDRFARKFENSTKRNTMFFKFWDDVFSTTNAPKSLKFSVTWLDSIAGSKWELQYKNSKGVISSALKIVGKGDRTWKTDTITIRDMDVTHTMNALRSDFTLVNTDAIDDIFNGIEVDIVRQNSLTDVPQIVGENKIIDDVLIYPNPTKSMVHIQSTEPVISIELCDLSGKSILKQLKPFDNCIDLSAIQNGLYFMKIAFEDRVIVKKVTKN